MMTERDKIIARVRKLLALAADVTSPNEAAIAAARARKLMDEWQISNNDIPDESEFTAKTTGKSRKFTPKWENIMAVAIAKFNDCIAAYRPCPISGYQVVFKGYGPDVDLCIIVYNRFVLVGCAACSAGLPTKKYNAKLGTVFKEAFAAEVCKRLRELTVERTSNVSFHGGKQLMIGKAKAVEEYFGHMSYVKTAIRMARDKREEIAAALGKKAGAEVQIHQEIGRG